jgi:hypothetical protein
LRYAACRVRRFERISRDSTGALLAGLIFALLVAASARSQTTPTLVATVSASGPLAQTYPVDTATLTGTTNGTGSLTFTVYGPDDTTCSQPPVSTSTTSVTGDGTYASVSFYPSAPGTYRFVARYGGNASNGPATTSCGDPAQVTTITLAAPTLATSASPSVAIGGALTDTARLTNAYAPTGGVKFTLFGPNDPTCVDTPAFTSTDPISTDNGRVVSDQFSPSQAGTYQFTATYAGDADNSPVSSLCGADGETVVVTDNGVAPHDSLTIQPSPAVTLGEQISDAATLATAGNPVGTITFRLYGPADPTCTSGAIAASTRTVLGNGTYSSDPFTTTSPGTYRFVATYSGDAADPPIATVCGDPSAAVVVDDLPPPVSLESFNLTRLSGDVSVQIPSPSRARAAIGFVPVPVARNVPIGSLVDASDGNAGVATASAANVQTGEFAGGVFKVVQSSKEGGLTQLKVIDPTNARTVCAGAAKARNPRTAVTKVTARVAGSFQTDGMYAAGTGHGATWTTSDRCDGTLIAVKHGVVKVTDFGRTAQITVRAGHSYLADTAVAGAGQRSQSLLCEYDTSQVRLDEDALHGRQSKALRRRYVKRLESDQANARTACGQHA